MVGNKALETLVQILDIVILRGPSGDKIGEVYPCDPLCKWGNPCKYERENELTKKPECRLYYLLKGNGYGKIEGVGRQ